MQRFSTLILVAFALVIPAPNSASAVPPPDEVPLLECAEAESGVCPPSLTVDIVIPIEGGGEVVGSATCPLELEIIAQTTGIMLIGHVLIEVEYGWGICSYGACGAIRVDMVGITVTVFF